MREDPIHTPVRHLLQETGLKLVHGLDELGRDKRLAAFGIVDLPAARGEHHHVESERKLVFELEVDVPGLRALLVRYHIGEFGGGIEPCLVLNGG